MCVCVCVCVCVEDTKACCPGKVQVNNVALLTIIIMLYVRSSELIHLITESLRSLTSISPSLLALALAITIGSELNFLRFHI
jgi:hypothetical protein